MAGHSGRAARRKLRRSQSPSLSESPGCLPTPPKPWKDWASIGRTAVIQLETPSIHNGSNVPADQGRFKVELNGMGLNRLEDAGLRHLAAQIEPGERFDGVQIGEIAEVDSEPLIPRDSG